MSGKCYITVAGEACFKLEEKKSIFLATCARVENEQEAQTFLELQREIYPDANHHVFAWLLGGKSSVRLQRFSDDGEPQGTSGPPVMDVLAKGNIMDSIIVVTRYFGGTLLGTGGLVKAYGQAAGGVIREAGLVVRLPAYHYHLHFPYRFADTLLYQLDRDNIEIFEKVFTSEVFVDCAVAIGEEEVFTQKIAELCLGQVRISRQAPCYLTRKKGKEENGDT